MSKEGIEPQGRGAVVPRARAGDACEPQRGLKGGEAAGGIPAGNRILQGGDQKTVSVSFILRKEFHKRMLTERH